MNAVVVAGGGSILAAAAVFTEANAVTFVVTFIATGVAAAIAGLIAVWGYRKQQKEGRRQERAKLYAEAVRAVEDYCEAPYRIRRRDGSAHARRELTESISEIKSRISFYAGWLSINAPEKVYTAYQAYVEAAQNEAGNQMKAMWLGRPTKRDKDVSIGDPLPRKQTDIERKKVLTAMKECLKK
jgi:hypothetical protein